MTNDYVKEAPYHPGYEDAVVDGIVNNWITEHLAYKERHLNTAKNIVEFVKESNRRRNAENR
jgi:predicted SAM-dependent methyltransferase